MAFLERLTGLEPSSPERYLVIFPTTSPLGLMASGTIVQIPVAAAPTGFLACGGAAVSRSAYAALFAAVGTQFGVGDGSTTFNVPTIANAVLSGVSVPFYIKT